MKTQQNNTIQTTPCSKTQKDKQTFCIIEQPLMIMHNRSSAYQKYIEMKQVKLQEYESVSVINSVALKQLASQSNTLKSKKITKASRQIQKVKGQKKEIQLRYSQRRTDPFQSKLKLWKKLWQFNSQVVDQMNKLQQQRRSYQAYQSVKKQYTQMKIEYKQLQHNQGHSQQLFNYICNQRYYNQYSNSLGIISELFPNHI